MTYQRAPLQFEGPPFITGQIEILADDLGQDPDPERNRALWGEFAQVELELLDDNGTPYPPPFGRKTRIKKTKYLKAGTGLLGQVVTESRILIQVVDILEYYRQPQGAFDPLGGAVQPGTSVLDILDIYLDNYGLEINRGKSDAIAQVTDLNFRFQGQGQSTIDHVHRIAMGNAEDAYRPCMIYVDNDEDIVFKKLNFNPATSDYVISDEHLLACQRINESDEQLPGVVVGRSFFDRITTVSGPDREVIPQADGGRVVVTINYGSTTTHRTQTYDSSGDEVQREVTVSQYLGGFLESEVKTISKRRDEFDPDAANGSALIPVQRTEVYYDNARGLVVRRRTVESEIESALAASFPDAGLDATSTTLRRRYELAESWIPAGDGDYRYTPTHRSYIKTQPNESATPRLTAEGSRPPNPVPQPSRSSTRQIPLFSTATLAYSDPQTINNPENLRGDGVFTTSVGTGLNRFSGTGTLVFGAQTIQITGGTHDWIGAGVLTGAGFFTGTGSFTGQVLLGRTREIDFANHPVDQFALDQLTTVSAQMIYGNNHGLDMQLAIAAALGAEVPANSTVDATIDGETQTFILSGELMTLEQDRLLWGSSALKLGTRDGVGNLTLSAQRRQEFLTDVGGININDVAGNPIQVGAT